MITGCTCSSFVLSGNNIKANITSMPLGGFYDDKLTLRLASCKIINVNYITVSGLQNLELNANEIVNFNPTIALPSSLTDLNLGSNQIVNFNPTIALPSSLIGLILNNNQMTLAGYVASQPWATNQTAFSSICEIQFIDNVDSVSGTALETILSSKNCTITS
jgi:Leucine-rich repeat (LRR) protein